MAKKRKQKKADEEANERVFQDLLMFLGSKNPIFERACRLLLEHEIWLIQQDMPHLRLLESCLRGRLETATEEEKIPGIFALDRVCKAQGIRI